MKIVLLGPPAAGKGTQAANLSAYFKIPSISTGAIIRNEISKGSPLGIKAKSFIDDGQLVPDDLVIDIVNHRIAEDDCKNGYILDGFPRTVVQAKAADSMGIQVNKVILIKIPDDEVVKRITGRRECKQCGSVYHTIYNPSKVEGICDKCGANTTHRADDTEETVRIRLSVYHSITEPLQAFYKEKGILIEVIGREKVEDTTKDMFEALGVKNGND